MTLIRGGTAGPDGTTNPDGTPGTYKNEVETDRAIWWAAMGGRSGIVRGMVASTVAGSLSLSLSAGAILAAERDAAAVEYMRGYFLWSDTATVVPFQPPSAQPRKDALVAAFVDTEDGPVGTGSLDVGPQILAVPGTSGVTTPLSNAAIGAYLGRGGWLRLSDVLISPGDTQILLASVTDAQVSLNRYRDITSQITQIAGWTVTSARYVPISNNCFELVVKATKTGTALTAPASGTSPGNYNPNIQVLGTLPAIITPSESEYGTFENNGAAMGGVEVTSGGNLWLLHAYPGTTIAVGGNITIRVFITVAQP